jgi:Zn-dependent protease
VLIVDSLETRKLSRRLWITTIWAMIVICVAGIYFEPVLRSPAMDIAPVGDLVSEFAFPWLCGLLIALWIALELERTTRDGRTKK